MARFARLEADKVREIISRKAAFKIAEAYHPDLISADLGGTAPIGDGFVDIPAAVTVKEGDLYDQATGTFRAPPPPPAPPPDAKVLLDAAIDAALSVNDLKAALLGRVAARFDGQVLAQWKSRETLAAVKDYVARTLGK